MVRRVLVSTGPSPPPAPVRQEGFLERAPCGSAWTGSPGLGVGEAPPPSWSWFLGCRKPVFPIGGKSGSPIPRGALAEAVKGPV